MEICENDNHIHPTGATRLILYSMFRPSRGTLETFRRIEPTSNTRTTATDLLSENPEVDDSVHWPSAQCLSLFSKRVQCRVFSSVTVTALCSSLYYINAHDSLVSKMLGESVAARASPIPLIMDHNATRGILESPLWRLTASRCGDFGSDNGMHTDENPCVLYGDQTSQLLQWSFVIAGGARIVESDDELGDEKVITCAARFVEDMHFICASSSTNDFVKGALWSVDSPFRRVHRTASESGPCLRCAACFASLPNTSTPTPFSSTPVNITSGVSKKSRKRAGTKSTNGGVAVVSVTEMIAHETDDAWEAQDKSLPYKKKSTSFAMDIDDDGEFDEDEEEDAEEEEEVDEEEEDGEVDEEEEEEEDDVSSASDIGHNTVIEVEEDGEYDLTDDDDEEDDASDEDEKVRDFADDDEDE